MILTDSVKQQIDSMDYYSMLYRWRFADLGDPMFEGDSGSYFKDRMIALRDANSIEASAISKAVGWEK